MNSLRKPLVFTVIMLSMVGVIIFHTDIVKFHSELKQIVSMNPAKNRSQKYILYWTSMFGSPDFYLGLGSKIFENCTYTNCYATDNRSLLPVEEFDALLFHAIEYDDRVHGLPKIRSPHQRYIIFDMESPVNTPDLSHFKNFFNWTMTYRSDSDIPRPYGLVTMKKTDYRLPTIEEIRNRTKKIAWFVSNCNTIGKREDLYKELNKFLPIDVYGKCGTLICSRANENACYDMLPKIYKFYLSFENSVCNDYVTEKLYHVLSKDIIPIVYGGADYRKIAPPNSVINVMDFTSIQNLVNYIQHLDSHPEEYAKFFDWKKDYVITSSKQSALCTLCGKLNEETKEKVYKNLYEWWFGQDSEKCSGSAFLKKFLG